MFVALLAPAAPHPSVSLDELSNRFNNSVSLAGTTSGASLSLLDRAGSHDSAAAMGSANGSGSGGNGNGGPNPFAVASRIVSTLRKNSPSSERQTAA